MLSVTCPADDKETMKLWIYHPACFRVDDPNLQLDHTKGRYWNSPDLNLRKRYREILPKLHDLLGTRQCLWCCTVRGLFVRMTEDDDLVEWELRVPFSQVLAFYSIPLWEDLIYTRTDTWDGLILEQLGEAEAEHKDIGALVQFHQLHPGWITCHGPPKPLYPKKGRSP